jgi:hypothetical protein
MKIAQTTATMRAVFPSVARDPGRQRAVCTGGMVRKINRLELFCVRLCKFSQRKLNATFGLQGYRLKQ